MEDLTVAAHGFDFSAVRQAMQRYVDNELLAGVSYAVLRGRDVVDVGCVGLADRERKVPMRVDHLHRGFSNTKLVVSCAALMLLEEGRFALDDPIERFVPQLAKRRVLKTGATSIADTEPARSPITIRHLMTHCAGLSYGVFDPGSVIFKAYNERNVRDQNTPLSDMIDVLAALPLTYHPGTSWEYSVATDVLGHLVEVVSGQRLDAFIQQRILDKLGMVDTGFVVPAAQRERLAAYYRGADLMNPMKPGLTRTENSPYPGAFVEAVPRLSGGGGLVTSLPDMVALLRSLLPDGPTLLKPQTITSMMTNQLPPGQNIRFAQLGEIAGKGFGLGAAVTVAPSPIDPADSVGEFQWGGIAGTHWWISPKTKLSGVLMAQRLMSFWHPFAFEFKRTVYRAMGYR
jgi:CubicO group peptidase (beta-lactamase class C family)